MNTRQLTTTTTLDHATVWRRLQIPGRRPVVLLERATASATVIYRFTGARANGTLTIDPTFANRIEAIPTAIRIRLGIPGPETDYRSETRAELPVINAVTLHGEVPAINPSEYLARTHPRLYFSRTGSGEPSRATNDYFCQILNAIIGNYITRPQTTNEHHSVAIQHAPNRLARLEYERIQPARAALGLQLHYLAVLAAAADDLRHLTHQRPHH
jgi:hypothetical protein